MASLDLSSAFDVVNVELLLKRLTVIGLPNDMLTLISNWLKTRYFYVSVDGNNSYVRLSNIGTVQGSILGPILYAIFVSPLFDLAKMTLFADDNYVIRWGKCLEELIVDMEASIELITKWLRQSGLKVNEMKTEICLFHRKDHLPVKIKINTVQVTTKKSMNVLGVTFDSKLQWQIQVQNSINKSKSALNALHLIRKYFTKTQLLQLITSNYYPILYYNAEIWLLPCLSPPLKQKILSASAAPLKMTVSNYTNMMSFNSLHYLNKRATPSQITIYKHALLLHKTYNSTSNNNDWVLLFFNQNFNSRQSKVNFYSRSKYKVGNNILANRFTILNNLIELNQLNLPFETYKVYCKKLFLT